MLKYILVLVISLGFISPAFAGGPTVPFDGCVIGNPCGGEDQPQCNCFNEEKDMRGCIQMTCRPIGKVCSCAWISNNGNPNGKHTRLTDCLPVVFSGKQQRPPGQQDWEPLYADCDERKEIPLITTEESCLARCIVFEEN